MAPARVFFFLSVLAGILLAGVTPPLRGPDESQHFLRAYGLAQGDIIPSMLDAEGRKGLFLPAALHANFVLFDAVPSKAGGFGIADLIKSYTRHKADVGGTAEPPVFVPYGGAEGYSPIGYVPYVAGVWLSQALGLEFVPTVYLMRLLGLIAFSAVTAAAIAIVPWLGWGFLAIAMLPAAAYARAVISADGATLASAMMVTALCLRGALGLAHAGAPGSRAMWLVISVLTKPPQLAFVLLEAMVHPWRKLSQRWRISILITVPPIALALAWSLISSADVAAWRLTELTGAPAEQFQPSWKLGYLIDNPMHFPLLVAGSMSGIHELWHQLIGVLGLFDSALRGWTYPVISILLVIASMACMPAANSAVRRAALVAGLTGVLYCATVFFIFYLVWTPIDAEQIWGVQGRYFLPALPLAAIVISAAVGRGLPVRWIAIASIATAVVSGAASIDAVLRVDWGLFATADEVPSG